MPHKDSVARREYHRLYKSRPNGKLCNRYYDAAKHANARAANYGSKGLITATDIRVILEKAAACHYCRRSIDELPIIWGRQALGIDHVIPLWAGGLNARQNLVAACQSCNASKHRGTQPGRWSRKGDSC